jgi:UPF0755 protein
MKRVLLVLFALAVLAAAGGYAYLQGRMATPARPGATEQVELVVPHGATARSLGPMLESRGVISDALLWRFFLWRNPGLAPKAGKHHVSPGMTLAQIGAELEGVPLAEDVPFAVIEGWRLRDTDAALVQAGLAKPGAYLDAASDPSSFHAAFPLPEGSLEGYLYPETYRVNPQALDVHALLQRQLDTFAERFWTAHADEIARSGRTLHELVTMASLLEREEPVPGQRALVAGILWKRIDSKTPLGVDATSRYLLPEWNDRRAFLAKLHDEQDPWNSRVHAGLPPGPIGAPTVDSLVAALRPQKSDFWYYLHDASRTLHPSRNALEHEALRKKYGVY